MSNTESNKYLKYINVFDSEKKKNFKNRSFISFLVVIFYLLVMVFSFLSDNTLGMWNKGIVDNKNIKGFFAIMFVTVLYIPLFFSIKEVIALVFDKKSRLTYWLLILSSSLLYFLPLIFLISATYFLNFFDNIFNIDKNDGDIEVYLACLYVIYLSLFFNTILIILILNILLKKQNKSTITNVIVMNFLMTFVPFGFFGFALIGLIRGWSTILFILISITGTDVMCYVFGSIFGKHKMAKVISPNKTWEGAIIGTIVTIGLLLMYCGLMTIDKSTINIFSANGTYSSISRSTVILWNICEFQTKTQTSESVPLWIILTFVSLGLIISSILGDLLFSYIKRVYKIKDFGIALKSHGGFLDRFDSFTITSSIYLFFTLISLGLFALSSNIEIIFGSPII